MSDTDQLHEYDAWRVEGTEFQYRTALDNHEPTRDHAYGKGKIYTRHDDDTLAIVLKDITDLRDADRAVYLVDDGRTVAPFYVAGHWKDPESETRRRRLILHVFPTNYRPNGERRQREGDGLPVDMGLWELGPRRAYHLKVTPEDVLTAARS